MVYTNKKQSHSDNAKNQLQVIVDYVDEYCKQEGIRALSGICLPSLPDIVKKVSLGTFKRTTQNVVVPVGVYDDPERQDQGNYLIDLSENNTYIIGSAMTGKTTLLQTMLLQLMENYTPDDVNVYIIDCGNMALKVFESSAMVGGVVLTSEEDRVINLFKLLFRIISERKKIFSEKGLGTHKAYVEAGYKDMPQIVLMIDNLAAFREYYDNLSEDFLLLSREGTSVGLSIVATANQTNAMNYKALSNYGTRISLVCNDSNEYMNLFDRCRIEPKDTAGRGLCMIDKRILEFQTALCAEGEKEYIRVDNMRRTVQSCNARYGGRKAMPIPFVPEVLKKSDLLKENKALYKRPYRIPVGMDFNTVQFVDIDLLTVGCFAVLGKAKSGKSNFVKHMLECIQSNIFDNLTRAYVIDDANMVFDFCQDYGYVSSYELEENSADFILEQMHDDMTDRLSLIRKNKDVPAEELLREEPLVLLVVENKKFAEYVSKNPSLINMFKDILENAATTKMCVIFSNVENANVSFNTPEVYKLIKNNKKAFVFDDISEFKFVDTSVKQQKDNAKPIKTGDAFMCFDGNIKRIRTILND